MHKQLRSGGGSALYSSFMEWHGKAIKNKQQVLQQKKIQGAKPSNSGRQKKR